MTGRHSLLADLEAKRCKDMEDSVEVLQAELSPVTEDTGYDPYDNHGPVKPLDVEKSATQRRRALRAKSKGR